MATNPSYEFRGMPHMDRDSLPEPTGLSPAEKTKIILVLLYMELGTSRFSTLIQDCSTEMEVVGVIDSADRAKTMANTLVAMETQERVARRLQFMCEELACRASDEIMQELAMHTSRVKELRAQLYTAYHEQAATTLASVLNEARRRASAMRTGHSGNLYELLTQITEMKTSE